MSVLIVILAIIAVVFWRSMLKIAAVVAVILMISGMLALSQEIHHIIK